MYLDFEDYRPETPRVPRAISVREGVLLSLLAHAVLVIALLLMPRLGWFQAAPVPVPPPNEPVVRFVQIEPLNDRTAPPKPQADLSDRDRRSHAPERVPAPDNPSPRSRGDTSEKIVRAQPEDPAGSKRDAPPSPPTPDPPRPTPETSVPAKLAPSIPIPDPTPTGGGLSDALRTLQRVLQDQNYQNPNGGATDRDPDIQFDSKGVEFGPWIRRFVAQVKRNWFIPYAAMAFKGHVVLQFYVDKDGTLRDIRVVQPSTTDSFNTAAFSALKLSNPTMALPPEYPAPSAFFTVTFHYNEGGGR